eukprot:Gb_20049 [translate_table: standard]
MDLGRRPVSNEIPCVLSICPMIIIGISICWSFWSCSGSIVVCNSRLLLGGLLWHLNWCCRRRWRCPWWLI